MKQKRQHLFRNLDRPRATNPEWPTFCKVSGAGGRRAQRLRKNLPGLKSRGAEVHRKSPGPKARGRFSGNRSARSPEAGRTDQKCRNYLNKTTIPGWQIQLRIKNSAENDKLSVMLKNDIIFAFDIYSDFCWKQASNVSLFDFCVCLCSVAYAFKIPTSLLQSVMTKGTQWVPGKIEWKMKMVLKLCSE